MNLKWAEGALISAMPSGKSIYGAMFLSNLPNHENYLRRQVE